MDWPWYCRITSGGGALVEAVLSPNNMPCVDRERRQEDAWLEGGDTSSEEE
jgi:hypothetical protein